MSLDLTVDFGRKVLGGVATIHAKVKKNGVDELVLDTCELTVTSVRINGRGGRGFRPAEWSFGTKHPVFGTPMRTSIPEEFRTVGTEILVEITYETAPDETCTAIQWLPPDQTAGKFHPYLFTQCQAIHCRTMIPCQDAPAVKASYDATLTVPAPLVALMSAISLESETNGTHTVFSFKQEVPIPAYLVAIAVGNLESRDIGPRTRVWSEPSMVELGAHEFADTERFLRAAEDLCGDYVWGRYDLLLLPPSFPYGGMENPCLTFVTPTLLAGDRSLADVVAHEIAHSWSGNLVTNATWSDFWMNEGFTVFIERRIISKVFGKKVAALKQSSGTCALHDAVLSYGCAHEFTKLHVNLDDVDPDDSFSKIPYEKGCAFLCYLEQLCGGPDFFEPFLKAYVLRFQYGLVSWDQFKIFFLQYCQEHGVSQSKLDTIDWNSWVHQPGMPIVEPVVDSTLRDEVSNAVSQWLETGSFSGNDANWNTDQKIVFLDLLLITGKERGGTPIHILDAINAKYEFSSTRNLEILFRWCLLGLNAKDERIFPLVVRLVADQGRMRFVRPLYRQLHSCNAVGKHLAIITFQKLRSQYHAIAQKMIARDLSI
mmetsp:Transcript_36341/g.58248  ORF Transcript_36341/g.58248 Transcript_36341/m.58248 type:complete len:598 (+) Transcript_36341:508-2301(+)